jgi:hypothetical protein
MPLPCLREQVEQARRPATRRDSVQPPITGHEKNGVASPRTLIVAKRVVSRIGKHSDHAAREDNLFEVAIRVKKRE